MAAGMSDLDNLIHVLTAIFLLDCVCVCVCLFFVHIYVPVHVNRRLATMLSTECTLSHVSRLCIHYCKTYFKLSNRAFLCVAKAFLLFLFLYLFIFIFIKLKLISYISKKIYQIKCLLTKQWLQKPVFHIPPQTYHFQDI